MPFDIGLRGLPVRLTGGVASDVGWSVFVDFGLNKDGPYLRTSGPKSFAGGETGALPNGADAPAADTAITGTENEANRPADVDTSDPLDGTFEAWANINYLQDDDASFAGKVEPGMWLWNLDTDLGCRIYKVEATKLHCDDPATAADEGVTWHQTGATDGDNYAVIELHPPDEANGGASRAEALRERRHGHASGRRGLHVHRPRSRLLVAGRAGLPRRLLDHPLPRGRARLPRGHDPRQGRGRRLRHRPASRPVRTRRCSASPSSST